MLAEMGNCGEKENNNVIQEEVRRDGMATTSRNSLRQTNRNASLKISLIGDSGVGKSAILTRVIHNRWEETNLATVGVAFAEKKIQTSTGAMLNLNLWDTAGQERFRSLTPLYLRGCSGVILVYSVDSMESFRGLEKIWLPLCNDSYGELFPPIFLLANKMDLPQKEHEVAKEMGETLAKKYNFELIEFSALDGTGQNELLSEIANRAGEFSQINTREE